MALGLLGAVTCAGIYVAVQYERLFSQAKQIAADTGSGMVGGVINLPLLLPIAVVGAIGGVFLARYVSRSN